MINYMIRTTLLTILFSMATFVGYAKEPSNVEKAVNEIVKKYEDEKGVTSMTLVRGKGLEIIKLMLNKEFGKSFMKGVTSVTIIDYSDASESICKSLKYELNVFNTLLKEFDLSKEDKFSDNAYVRCFTSEYSGTLSDFVIALEDDKSKIIMYMAGIIIIE